MCAFVLHPRLLLARSIFVTYESTNNSVRRLQKYRIITLPQRRYCGCALPVASPKSAAPAWYCLCIIAIPFSGAHHPPECDLLLVDVLLVHFELGTHLDLL